MRVTTQSAAMLVQSGLSRSAERIGRLYAQASSGQRVNALADDPVAAAQTVRLQAALDALDSRRSVLDAGNRLLGVADTSLGTMTEALRQCGEAALQASSSGLDDTARQALAEQVRAGAETLRVAANATSQGLYVFAGTATDTVPFADSGAGVTYAGNDQELQYRLGAAGTVAVSLTGATVLNFADASGQRAVAGVDTDVFTLLDNLADSIASGDTEKLTTLTEQANTCREHVLSLRGQVGLRVQRCETGTAACDTAEVQLKALLSETQDVDIVEAVTTLSSEQTAYQAALSMASKLLGMTNLFEVQW